MPPDSQSFRARPDPDIMVVEDDADVPAVPMKSPTDPMEVGKNSSYPTTIRSPNKIVSPVQDNNIPSTSSGSGSSKMLKFNIQYCDRVINIELPENGTVSKLDSILDNFS